MTASGHPSKGSATALLVALVAGASAGFVAGSMLRDGPTVAAPNELGSRAIVDELQRLSAELRRIHSGASTGATANAATVGRAAEPAARTAAEAGPSATGSPAYDELLAALQQMLIRVEQIASRQVADSGTLQRLAAQTRTDERALGDLQARIDANWDTAQHELFLMPMAQVLQRFGPPTRVDLQSSGMQWGYDFTGNDGRKWVGITFHDGVVVRVD